MTSEQIKEIAENLDCGLRCFVHRIEGSITILPDEDNVQDFDYEHWKPVITDLQKNASDYVEITKMDSGESFKLMKKFITTITNADLANKLTIAISGPKPFRYFKSIIDNSERYRQSWFEYKASQLESWVDEQVRFNGL